MPSELKASEDNEIKIILQHQFWDLTIDDEKFSVVLSFNGKKKNISVLLALSFLFQIRLLALVYNLKKIS